MNYSGIIIASALVGLPAGNGSTFPSTARRVRTALDRLGIPTHEVQVNGGVARAVDPVDLHQFTRLALAQRDAGIAPEDAPSPDLWVRFSEASPKIQAHARRLFDAVSIVDRAVSEGRSIAEGVRTATAETEQSEATVSRAWKTVRDVPRADWLPTLMPNYKPGGERAEVSEEAMSFFLGLLKDAAARYPLMAAHRRTEKVAAKKGWSWPSYDTIRRRFKEELSEGEKALLRSGRKALDKSYPPQTRTVVKESALSLVNIDGRMADVFVKWEDGSVSRPVVIALQDVFSRKMLGYEIAKSENADATKALLLRVFDTWGLFDAILMDNGRAFASLKLTGGSEAHRFRWAKVETEIKGLYPSLGIRDHFATPAHGQAKPVERGFRDMAEAIDTAPELKRGYCGHRPDAKPEEFDGSAIPIEEFRAVYARDVAEHNARPGRRTEMAGGKKSFDEVFAESFMKRVRKPIVAAQRRFFYLDQAICTVNAKTGALKSKHFEYWSSETQKALQPWRGKKVRLLFDPAARDRPVSVETLDGQFLAEVPCLKRGEFLNAEHARDHARAKAQYKKAETKKLEARNAMSAAKRRDIEAECGLASPPTPSPVASANVVMPSFGAPALRPDHGASKRSKAAPEAGVLGYAELNAALSRSNEQIPGNWRQSRKSAAGR